MNLAVRVKCIVCMYMSVAVKSSSHQWHEIECVSCVIATRVHVFLSRLSPSSVQ